MNEQVIQIGGKSYKQCDIVMLLTKEQRWKIGNEHDDRYEFYSFVDKKLYSRQSNAHNWSLSHLYILSSEEIKEGNQYLIYNGQICKTFTYGERRDICFKIDNDIVYCQNNKWRKIISTTNSELNLPRPSDDFIKSYIKAQGKIDKVLVEVICNKLSQCNCTDNYSCLGTKFKVAPDNTITIKPIQEEKAFWSRKEVIKLCMDAMLYSYMDLPENLTPIQGMNKLIEENL